MTTPRITTEHHFQTRMRQLLPGMLKVLDPFFFEMRSYMWFRALTDRSTSPALNLLLCMLWHHSHQDKGLEPFILMFRSFLAVHCRERCMKLARGQVQELQIAFMHFFVEVLGHQVHGDLYTLAYHATDHWLVPLVLAKRAEKQRQYYAQLPELWFDIMHPIDSDYDPEGKLHNFPAMSLFLPILEVLRELLCFSPLNKVDRSLWSNVP